MRSQPSIATSAIHNFSDKSAALKLRSVHANSPTALALGRTLSVERGSGACQEIDAGGPLSQKSTAPEHQPNPIRVSRLLTTPYPHVGRLYHKITPSHHIHIIKSYTQWLPLSRVRRRLALPTCQTRGTRSSRSVVLLSPLWYVQTQFEARLHGSMQLTCLSRLLESPDSERPHSSTPSSLPPSRTTPITSAVTQSRSTRPSRLRSPRPSLKRSSLRVWLP